ncbi:MAG: glycosyltransferase family 4 protein [Nitrospirota bacterium]|jgi:glycosyltransferase involved in cell wall biosynthesis
MKICFYTATFLPIIGGAEIFLHNFATSLSNIGHEITVLAPNVRGKNNKIDANYNIRRYQRPSSKRFAVRQVLLYLFWEKIINNFDILHCHGAYPPGYVGATFKTIFKTPLVIRPHGSDILPDEGIRRHPRLDRRVKKALFSADAIVAQSNYLKEEIEKAGVPDDKIRLIPNGVMISEFDAYKPSRNKEQYILAMGSMTKKKGFDILISAFSHINKKFPEVRLNIAGVGPELENYKRFVNEKGLNGPVNFLGNVTGEKKIALFKECLFFVNSSRREPFANVNLEALAAGKPIIATSVGGNIEVVRDGYNGLLVPAEDPVELGKAMVSLVKDKELIKRMSIRSKEIAKRYDWDLIVKRYISLYEDLLKRN